MKINLPGGPMVGEWEFYISCRIFFKAHLKNLLMVQWDNLHPVFHVAYLTVYKSQAELFGSTQTFICLLEGLYYDMVTIVCPSVLHCYYCCYCWYTNSDVSRRQWWHLQAHCSISHNRCNVISFQRLSNTNCMSDLRTVSWMCGNQQRWNIYNNLTFVISSINGLLQRSSNRSFQIFVLPDILQLLISPDKL